VPVFFLPELFFLKISLPRLCMTSHLSVRPLSLEIIAFFISSVPMADQEDGFVFVSRAWARHHIHIRSSPLISTLHFAGSDRDRSRSRLLVPEKPTTFCDEIWIVDLARGGVWGKTRVWREKTLGDVPGKKTWVPFISEKTSAVSAEMNAGKLVSLMFVLPTITSDQERFTRSGHGPQVLSTRRYYIVLPRRTARWRSFADGGESQ